MGIRILLVDDHRVLRDGLRLLLDSQPDFQIVAEAEDGNSAVDLAKRLHPDVVVMDIAMPGMNGIDAADEITQENPQTRIVFLSAYINRHAPLAIKSDAATGLVPKFAAFEEVSVAIRTVASGHSFRSASLDDSGAHLFF